MSFKLRDIGTDKLIVNMGPSHPLTHGTLRIQLELDGERVERAACEIGYLHRCLEKEAEVRTWNQMVPYCERLNYLSPVNNSIGWCLAVEKLLGVEAPARAQAIRVLLCEFSRIMDHLVCIGTSAVDLGALTNFWYFFNYREKIYTLLEEVCGARLMVNYPRVGGVVRDLPDGWVQHARQVIRDLPDVVKDVKGLLARNRILVDRLKNIGILSGERAIAYGFSGPTLRASGVKYDLRRAEPYMGYEQYDFEIPTRTTGDCFDRIFIRFDEMEQSARIIEQALDKLPSGPFLLKDSRIALPPKAEVYGSIEGLVNHFKLVFEGIRPPVGEVYHATEAANGELGYYIVSDGEGKAYRAHCRAPCFTLFSAYPELLKGHMVADAVAVLGGLNIVAGELER